MQANCVGRPMRSSFLNCSYFLKSLIVKTDIKYNKLPEKRVANVHSITSLNNKLDNYLRANEGNCINSKTEYVLIWQWFFIIVVRYNLL